MRPGTLVGDRFEVSEVAGSGGMGTVYHAIDRLTGEPAALKLLASTTVEQLSRFQREATILASLDHPAIVSYIAHGTTFDQEPYLAMQWLSGETLDVHLVRGPLPIEHALALGIRIAEALAVAHQHGVIHRDIKPQNLLLPTPNEPKQSTPAQSTQPAGSSTPVSATSSTIAATPSALAALGPPTTPTIPAGTPAQHAIPAGPPAQPTIPLGTPAISAGAVAQPAIRVLNASDQLWQYENAVVLDFGIARPGGSTHFSTRTGEIVGSPGYMAPEQARGDRALDTRVDVFALGCVLYECVTGMPPFIAEHVVGVLAKVLFETPTNIYEMRPSTPPALVDIIVRMLHKDPAERFNNGLEVLAALRDVDLNKSTPELEDTAPPAIGIKERQLLSVIIASEHHTSFTETIELSRRPDLVGSLRNLVADHGGALEELADGSLVVSFAPTGVATDQAARAVNCALAMRKRMTHHRIALATGSGEVAVGLPIGEVLDRAVRRLKAADAGNQGVLIDELTAGLLGAGFQIVEAGAGLALQVESDAPQPTLMGQVTPFVGRRRELNTLVDTYEECLEDSVARAVLVTGAPGLGKSRLASELLKRIGDSAEAQIWIGRADVTGDASPFRLLASTLRHELNLQDGEALAASQQKLKSRLKRHFDDDAIDALAPALGSMLSVPFEDASLPSDPLLMRDLIRQAWIDLLSAECEKRPVLLIVDDLQWGDLPSIKLIDVALRALRHKPFMVLALARPEVHQRFPKMWHERGVAELRLPELSRRSCDKLVAAVLDDPVDEAERARLIEQAGGNPLYLEELLREAARDSSHKPPATVLAMLQVRLETLDPELRRVLRAASVFGTIFWQQALESLLGDSPTKVAQWIEQLAAQELVIASHTAKFPRFKEYRFRHELLREVAYTMLTEHDQRVAHHLAARWLHQNGETEPAVLASHYERGGEPSGAVVWYRRAAARAMEGDDFEAVLRHAEHGVRCNREATSEALGELRLIESDAHRWRGEVELARQRARQAYELLTPGKPTWYSALRALAMACRDLHQLQVEDESRLRTLLLQEPNPQAQQARARVLAISACQLLLVGEQQLYAAFCDELGQLDGALIDPVVEASLCEARALQARIDGAPGSYLRHMTALVACEERRGALRYACKARVNLGYAAREIGALNASLQMLTEAGPEARRMGLDSLAAAAEHNLGFTLALLGDLAAGAELERRAIDAFERFGVPLMEGVSRVFLALILSRQQNHPRAIEQAKRALEILADFPAGLAGAEGALAEILLAADQPKEALAAARRGMALLDELGQLEEGEPRLRLAHAEALLACDQQDESRRALQTAHEKLLERANQIGDEALREGFLKNIPEHARTLKLATEV